MSLSALFPSRVLLLAFAAVILCFVASTAYSQRSEGAIGGEALLISDRAAPSIEHLARARAELSHLTILMRDRVDALAAGDKGPDPRECEHARQHIEHELSAYSALAGERDAEAAIRREFRGLDQALPRVLEAVERGEIGTARRRLVQEFLPAMRSAGSTLLQAIDHDAREVQDAAWRIKAQRRWSQRVAYTLDGLSVALAALVAGLALWLSRRHALLLSAHGRMVQERAEELELFAGRVAHDIRGPLSVAGLALEHAARAEALPPRLRPSLERGRASIERTARIVDSLLNFARAGAHPPEGVRCDVGAVLEDALGELGPVAAEAGIELRTEPFRPCQAACEPGILTSLIGNLVRNALKYMGEGPRREVTVRVLPEEARVRVEVEDTGPGLAPALARRVFDLYVRAAGASQPGIGLGLATVKRLTEAHGGRAGVRSVLGAGSTFWFELPRR